MIPKPRTVATTTIPKPSFNTPERETPCRSLTGVSSSPTAKECRANLDPRDSGSMTITPGEIECDYCGKKGSDQSKWVVRSQAFGPSGTERELTFCCPEHANAYEPPRAGG